MIYIPNIFQLLVFINDKDIVIHDQWCRKTGKILRQRENGTRRCSRYLLSLSTPVLISSPFYFLHLFTGLYRKKKLNDRRIYRPWTIKWYESWNTFFRRTRAWVSSSNVAHISLKIKPGSVHQFCIFDAFPF